MTLRLDSNLGCFSSFIIVKFKNNNFLFLINHTECAESSVESLSMIDDDVAVTFTAASCAICILGKRGRSWALHWLWELCGLGFEIYMLIHTDETETHVQQLQQNVDILHVAERVRFLVLVFRRFLSTLDPRSSFLFHLSFLFVKSEPSPVNVAEEAQAMRKVPAIILCVSQFTEWEGAKFALALALAPLFKLSK